MVVTRNVEAQMFYFYIDYPRTKQKLVSVPTPAPAPKHEPSLDNVLRECALAYWRLHYGDPSDRSTEAKLYRQGWIGITVTNTTKMEDRMIREWVEGRDQVVITRRSSADGESAVIHFIGEYTTYCYGVWTATQEMHDELIAFLKSIPKRTRAIVTTMKKYRDIKPHLEGTNSVMIKGSEAVAIGLSEEIDETTDMLIRLMI